MLLQPGIQRSWCRVVTPTGLTTNALRSMRVEAKKGSNASKVVAKTNLPTKICVVCQRPFTWRKKWEKVWDIPDGVKYCSERCRRTKGSKEAASEED